MVKKNNTLIPLILIGILGISFYYFLILDKTESGIHIHYYKDGIEVSPPNIFSVVQINTSFYDQISLEIIGENTGDYPISNMQVSSASPIQFEDALPSLLKSLEVGETKTLWISDKIDVHQFESLEQPVKFWVNISGESPYAQRKIYDYIDINLIFGDLSPLIVTDSITIDGDHKYSRVIVCPDGVINVGSKGWLNISTPGYMIILGTIQGNGVISNTGEGGDGAYHSMAIGGGGGGSHYIFGANGGSATGAYGTYSGGSRGNTYSDLFENTLTFGSKGGNSPFYGGGDYGYPSYGGYGGAGVYLKSPSIVLSGNVNLQGNNGGGGSGGTWHVAGGGGGGSGGTLVLVGNNIDIDNSTINLNGGNGGVGSVSGACSYSQNGGAGGGGGGSGGILKVFYKDSLSKSGLILNLNGGIGGTGAQMCGAIGNTGGTGTAGQSISYEI